MIELISSSSSSLLSCAQSDKAKAGTLSADVTSSTVRLCLSQGIVCVCVFVCACEATLGLFLVVLEGCVLLQRKAGLTELRLSAYLAFTGGVPQPFSPSLRLHKRTHTHTHTHTRARAHYHRRQQCQQLIFMHLNPYPCGL